MYSPETFLDLLYALAEPFCNQQPLARRPGPAPALSVAQTLALTVFAQWQAFPSERAFYRWATGHLRSRFPRLPVYSQYNRAARRCLPTLAAFLLFLADQAQSHPAAYEILDSFGVATRNRKRRGAGRLPLCATEGYCSRLGWFEGFRVLDAVTPEGILTGLGFGSATTQDQPLTETLLACRHRPHPGLPSVGRPAAAGVYLADKGFNGAERHWHWAVDYDASVVCAPRLCDPVVWPEGWHQRLKSLRQVIETVHEKLLRTFRLATERPQTLSGFYARLCAKAALHNFCIGLNKQRGRPPLAFADLIDW
jgi:hypothetical protein